jgi:hypothetical protein
MSEDTSRLRMLRLELPNHWHGSEESIWAMPIADNLYEIRNVPYMAYGLNFLDVVYAERTPHMAEACIRRVVRRSGHKTLRCIFLNNLPEDEQTPYLEDLAALGVSFERVTPNYLCIDVHPEGSIASVQERLEALEEAGVLEYETCEARMAGSFDDAPDEMIQAKVGSVGNA